MFVQKIPLLREFTADNPLTEIVPEMGIDETKGDTVLVKKYPSAFAFPCGTPVTTLVVCLGAKPVGHDPDDANEVSQFAGLYQFS